MTPEIAQPEGSMNEMSSNHNTPFSPREADNPTAHDRVLFHGISNSRELSTSKPELVRLQRRDLPLSFRRLSHYETGSAHCVPNHASTRPF